MRSGPACWLAVLCCLLAAVGVQRAFAAPADLVGAANGEHLWFAIDSREGAKGIWLCHAAVKAEGAHYRPQASLPRMPYAMASWQTRVWLVFESPPNGQNQSAPRWEVFTIQVEEDAALGGYVSVPKDRLDIAPPLPGNANLQSFTAGSDGPVALLAPAAAADKPRLLRLQQDRWTDIDLPPDFGGGPPYFAMAFDGGLVMFGQSNQKGQAIRLDRNEHGDWSRHEIALDLAKVRSLIMVAGQLAAVLADEAGGKVEVALVRHAGVIAVTDFPHPTGGWTVLGNKDSLRLLQRQSDGQLTQRIIDIRSGSLGPAAPMEVQPLSSSRLWQMALFITVSVAALLLLFLVRAAPADSISLPDGWVILPISQRFLALAIDAAPAALATMFLLRVRVGDLFAIPLPTADAERTIPYLVMAGLLVAHSTIAELGWGRSLGKSVIGARLVRLDGSRPRIGQVLVRSGIKCIVLLVPPLALLAMLNPNVQGLHDMAAGTLVVHESDKSPKSSGD